MQEISLGGVWANCKSKHLRNDRCRAMILLDRCVQPVVNFRVSRWPPQSVIAQELDQTQAKMIASILGTRPLFGEEPSSFHRRRMREAHCIAREKGTWSSKWFSRFQQWNEHLDRHPDHPGARILATRNSAWLQSQRAKFTPVFSVRQSCWTSLAGRTDTRIQSGYIAQRWESGRAFGNQHL